MSEKDYKRINFLVNRIYQLNKEDGGDFPHPIGNTRLARAERAVAGHTISSTISTNLAVSSEHLLAFALLLEKAGYQLPFAPYTLLRAVIESLGQGMWLLGAKTSEEMVIRNLIIAAYNINRSSDVSRTTGDKTDKISDLRQQALEAGITEEKLKELRFPKFSSTKAISEGSDAFGISGLLLMWRLCSGFAHGLSWAVLGASNLELDEVHSTAKITNNHEAQELCLYWSVFGYEILYNVYRELSTATTGLRPTGEVLTRNFWKTYDVLEEGAPDSVLEIVRNLQKDRLPSN